MGQLWVGQTETINSGTSVQTGPRQKSVYHTFFKKHRLISSIQIAIDYNAPFLTLAAYSRMYNNNPPFFTSLAPGMYDSVRPSGFPCDPAFPCTAGNPGLGLNKAEKIAMSVGISVPGFIILVLVAWLIILSLRRRTKT